VAFSDGAGNSVWRSDRQLETANRDNYPVQSPRTSVQKVSQ